MRGYFYTVGILIYVVVVIALLDGCGTAPIPARPAISGGPPAIPTNAVVAKPSLMRLAVSKQVAAGPSLTDWAQTMDDARPNLDGSMLIGSNTLAHLDMINMLVTNPPVTLISTNKLWLINSNQARAFMELDLQLRLQKNPALYSGQ